MKEKRCLKFTGYIYLPDEKESKDYSILRKFSAKTMGRIEIFDENNKKVMPRMAGFDNIGQMLNVIMTAYKKSVLKRLPIPSKNKRKSK